MTIAQDSNRSFWNNKSGSTAMMASIFLPALIGFSVLAVDVGHYYSLKTEMQQAADFSGLAVLTQIRDAGDTDFLTVAQAHTDFGPNVPGLANRNMPNVANKKAVKDQDIQFGHWDFTNKTFDSSPGAIPANAIKIKAQLSEQRDNAAQTFFGKIFKDHVDITVSSTAVLPVPASFHILSANASRALVLNGGDLDVPRTLVNSTSSDAIDASVGTNQVGGFVLTASGATDLASQARVGRIITNVDPVADFLRDMPAPVSRSGCEPQNVFDELNPVIPPGVYCGGLIIRNHNNAVLSPGTYIIQDGPMIVENAVAVRDADGRPVRGRVQGDGVLLFFTGNNSSLQVRGSEFNIRAQTAGPHAGVAIFADRAPNAPAVMMLESVSAYIGGIFYAPDSHVDVFNSNVTGICSQICLVTNTMRIGGVPRSADSTNSLSGTTNGSSRVNYGTNMRGRASPFTPNGIEPIPPTPPALMRTFRPYIISG